MMVLYGASGHGKVIYDILNSMGVEVDYFVDDNPELYTLHGLPVERNVGVYDELIISIGNNRIRKALIEQLVVAKYVTAIDKSAILSDSVLIGDGTVVMQGAIIQNSVTIGNHVIINSGASVDHDCLIDHFVHISPHATLCGNVTVGEGSWIGAGAIILPGVTIGSWSVVGAGTVVTNDIPNNVTVYDKRIKTIINHDK